MKRAMSRSLNRIWSMKHINLKKLNGFPGMSGLAWSETHSEKGLGLFLRNAGLLFYVLGKGIFTYIG
ncbi:hypothetical protein CLV48_104107 [Cecembia rubra]|uniref:Uncharacterized protein n=2 Tax=Cecembia rubra TaxID=1485585 RepID=A0A2P8E643_9BACT|nr:hypothetical protein CLV48_104107 [Cecembia rubra]